MDNCFEIPFEICLSVFACKPRVDKVFITINKYFWGSPSRIVGQSQDAHSHHCDQSGMKYLNRYLRYQTIEYDRVSLIFLSRST